MATSHTLYITTPTGEEYEYEVEFEATPYDPGSYHRPPEGGEVLIDTATVRDPESGEVVEEIGEEELIRRYAEDRASLYETRRRRLREWWEGSGNPPFRRQRTNEEYAREELEHELHAAWAEAMADERDAAAEWKYDLMKDEGII